MVIRGGKIFVFYFDSVMEIFIEFYDIFIFEFFIIEVYWIVYIFCVGYGLSLEVKYS